MLNVCVASVSYFSHQQIWGRRWRFGGQIFLTMISAWRELGALSTQTSSRWKWKLKQLYRTHHTKVSLPRQIVESSVLEFLSTAGKGNVHSTQEISQHYGVWITNWDCMSQSWVGGGGVWGDLSWMKVNHFTINGTWVLCFVRKHVGSCLPVSWLCWRLAYTI
jgi:hypothetical protein